MVKVHEKMGAFLSAVCEEQGTKHGCHCCQGADKHRKVSNKKIHAICLDVLKNAADVPNVPPFFLGGVL